MQTVAKLHLAKTECRVAIPMYNACNDLVLSMIPCSVRRTLDVGCGSGALGEALKKRQSCYVVGVTCDRQEVEVAGTRLDRVVLANIETENLAPF